jgi:ketol-acid reductoisomerase
MQVLTDRDVDPSPILSRTVAILGYGNQGAAHAQNLRDSGVEVIVGARAESTTRDRAEGAGFEVLPIERAVERAAVVAILAPDEAQAALFSNHVEQYLREGQALAFGHGFSIHFEQIVPPPFVDVVLVAPVGPGKLLRSRYVEGAGIPCLTAVHQDATLHARELALAYARAIGGGRAGILETTFKDECETDLFGEQTVICGGVSALITAGFETLVEAGYPEELAFFECCHQMKLLVDLIFERGIAGMRHAISNTAKYGDLTRGPRVIDASVKARMREILGEIQRGEFADEWVAEVAAGAPELRAAIERSEQHPIERAGARLRPLVHGS